LGHISTSLSQVAARIHSSERGSEAFLKFPLARFTKNVLGAFSQFMRLENEAVCCEVQTHFGSFCLLSFIKVALGAFSRFALHKTKLLFVKFRHIVEVLCLQHL